MPKPLKITLRILLVIIVLVLVSAIGFIMTLQVFEYRPNDLIPLDIEDNYDDSSEHYALLDQSIRFLTFNIGYASLSHTEDFAMDGGTKGRMDTKAEVENNLMGIRNIILDQQADVILIQEVDVDSNRSYNINQYDDLKTAVGYPVSLAYNYRCIFVPFPLNPSQMMGKVNSGILTMTDFYVASSSRHQLPGSFSWPLRLANLKRAINVSRIPIADSDKFLVVINVHLSAYDDGSMRLEETAYLQSVMLEEYESGNYVVVGGDFNQTFPGAVTITEEGGVETFTYHYPLRNPDYWQAFPFEDDGFTSNDFQFAYDLNTPTCRLLHQPYDLEHPENNQYYVIDGFIVSDNIDIVHVETLDENFIYSDHNPVLLEIRLIP